MPTVPCTPTSPPHLTFPEHQTNQGLQSLILAGSETSATLMTGALYFLLTNTPSYTTLVQEIRSTSSLSLASLNPSTLPYLHAVIQETFRMYPPAALSMPRRTPSNGAVIDGHHVPGDTYVGFPHFSAYRYEKNFERAGKWRPERWIEGEIVKGAGVLQPFSLGPYGCLGVK